MWAAFWYRQAGPFWGEGYRYYEFRWFDASPSLFCTRGLLPFSLVSEMRYPVLLLRHMFISLPSSYHFLFP